MSAQVAGKLEATTDLCGVTATSRQQPLSVLMAMLLLVLRYTRSFCSALTWHDHPCPCTLVPSKVVTAKLVVSPLSPYNVKPSGYRGCSPASPQRLLAGKNTIRAQWKVAKPGCMRRMRRSLSDTALEGLGALVAEPLPADGSQQPAVGTCIIVLWISGQAGVHAQDASLTQ